MCLIMRDFNSELGMLRVSDLKWAFGPEYAISLSVNHCAGNFTITDVQTRRRLSHLDLLHSTEHTSKLKKEFAKCNYS